MAGLGDLKMTELTKFTVDPNLPIAEKADEIREALLKHQVIIVAGETGSGKSTQLPKICLELFQEDSRLIGHTQPRRLAARTIADRVAEETKTILGDLVGYKIRFNDLMQKNGQKNGQKTARLKLMTDGILLAEIERDRYLSAYKAIIIDEAHERSLNIDFLLGYLKRILPKRPDLKIIITSATLDHQKFADHFNQAPLIEVSGRSYPVSIQYRPLYQNPDEGQEEAKEAKEERLDLNEGIYRAASSLIKANPWGGGDILVFLATEREIRECQKYLEKKHLRGVEILPLFGRLSIGDQQKIFSPSGKRKIVLSTNVAETSVTVPGVHYVIDSGTARLSRYSHRSKIQRLPIESISKASANQRAGRCGRIAPGICIRLYSEEDFNLRVPFTEPEILRTNLAGVILKMAVMGLGKIEDFPFLTSPDPRFIKDGYRLLHELGAMKIPEEVEELPELLPLGRVISTFSVDPRLAKMLVTANQKKVLSELLIITSFLSIQDVRERPMNHQPEADSAHRSFWFGGSDFLSILVLWHQSMVECQSNTERRNFCKQKFLNFMRLREWGDLYRQLCEQVEKMGWGGALSSANGKGVVALSSPLEGEGGVGGNFSDSTKGSSSLILPGFQTTKSVSPSRGGTNPAKGEVENPFLEKLADPIYQAKIHQSILSGLLSHIGRWEENKRYQGTRQGKWELFPGSSVFAHPPKWMMCYELVETHKAFARMIGKIDPVWLESLASHLIKKTYSEPFYEENSGRICAWMKISLYGLDIIPKRSVNYADLNPELSRELFIKEGLVSGKLDTEAPFILHNRKLEEELIHLENKARRLDVLADDGARFSFYDQRIPKSIVDVVRFNHWWKSALRENPKGLDPLYMTEEDLISRASHEVQDFPDFWRSGPLKLPLKYHFDPLSPEDGVTLTVPSLLWPQVSANALGWLVPGLLLEKITALIRSLPKSKRRACIPAPNFAKACLEALSETDHRESLLENVALVLKRLTGVSLSPEDFDLQSLDRHLFMRVEVLGSQGEVIESYRDVLDSKSGSRDLGVSLGDMNIAQVAEKDSEAAKWEKVGVKEWDFGDLPTEIKSHIHGVEITLYPAIEDKQTHVDLIFEHTLEKAELVSKQGVLRLFFLTLQKERGQARLSSKLIDAWVNAYKPFGNDKAAREDLEIAAMIRLLEGASLPRSLSQFEKSLEKRADFLGVAEELARQGAFILEEYFSLQKKLKRLSGQLALIESLGDISDQLSGLGYAGFLTKTPPKYFKRLGVYLKGINIRLERLANNPLKDREGLLAFRKNAQKSVDKAADKVSDKWAQEEYRLFAFSTGLASLK